MPTTLTLPVHDKPFRAALAVDPMIKVLVSLVEQTKELSQTLT